MQDESGFTLIELLTVLMILAILLTIAVPAFLSSKDRASKQTAQANVRGAVPVVETYYADHGTYVGMDAAALSAIDAGVHIIVVSAGASTYCIKNTQNGFSYYKDGPNSGITASACT